MAFAACGSLYSQFSKASEDLPNILWLTSEDNSPFLGCYGDEFATTPNLDKLASEGFLYTHAYANAPVCAPARNTIITGVYATSGGNQHMRSHYRMSDRIRLYPKYLRELGYYCTNNIKTDYNIDLNQYGGAWDQSSDSAHYKSRKEGQPFFAIFNTTISHESSVHKWTPTEELRHDPEAVPIPPYHPRTAEMKHDWAQYYDKVEDMDSWIGEKLRELDEAGLSENTIVFYYGDHGGVMARSKRYVYESGTHVPFIVRVPEKYKHWFPNEEKGTKVDRMISFVDLAPTLLSIVGIPVPEYLQGNAFLGSQKTPDPEYAYMFRGRMDERYDMSRALRDQQFRYIRNYMPHRIYGQHLSYLWRAPSIGSWEQACLAGECNAVQSVFWHSKPSEELYDTENDPWEVKNLADDPQYADVLARMRKANHDWVMDIMDTGFIPEPDWQERVGEMPMYDYMRENDVDMMEIVEAAELASLGKEESLPAFIRYLENDDPAVRYWGATGLLILGKKASSAIQALKEAVNDPSSSVAIVAAEALYKLGEKELAEQVLLENLKNDNFTSNFALNSIDILNINSLKAQTEIQKYLGEAKHDYSKRAATALAQKWDSKSK